MIIRHDELPGFLAAVKRENDVRDAAFLDIPTPIGPARRGRRIELRPMCPLDLLILDGLGNPLLSGGLPDRAQLGHFLFLLSRSLDVTLQRPIGYNLRRWRFGRRIRRFPYLPLVHQCRQYLDRTFQDSPEHSGPAAIPYSGWCAHLVNDIATAYGWSEQTILRTSLRRLFQYRRCIRRQNDPDYRPSNPSDRIKREGMIGIFEQRITLLALLRRRAQMS